MRIDSGRRASCGSTSVLIERKTTDPLPRGPALRGSGVEVILGVVGLSLPLLVDGTLRHDVAKDERVTRAAILRRLVDRVVKGAVVLGADTQERAVSQSLLPDDAAVTNLRGGGGLEGEDARVAEGEDEEGLFLKMSFFRFRCNG